MKKRFSFIEKFQFKYIFGFCLILVTVDISNLFRVSFAKQQIINGGNFWFYLAIGIALIFMAATIFKYTEEKIGVIAFGCAFILNSLAKFVGYQTSLIFATLLDLTGIYCFWLSYKIYKHNTGKHLNPKILLILLVILLLPPIVLWLIGVVQ